MSTAWTYEYVGPLETCDCCGDEFALLWIVFTGRQFLCLGVRR